MNISDTKKTITNAVETYGVDAQTNVCMEECAELIQAISKCKRYGCTGEHRDNLIEEIADVIICIDELQVMYNVSLAEINEMINAKLERLKVRLNNEKSNVIH